MQGSWVTSANKCFADEKEDTALQIAENSKCFGITSSIIFFSNEGKEFIIQYQGHCGCPGCAYEEMMKLWGQDHRQLEDKKTLSD